MMKITRFENAIFGLRPIIEAIQAGKEIDTLFIQKGLKNELFQELWQLVRTHKVNYKHVPVEKLNRLTRKNHQELHKAHLARIQLPGMHPLMYQ